MSGRNLKLPVTNWPIIESRVMLAARHCFMPPCFPEWLVMMNSISLSWPQITPKKPTTTLGTNFHSQNRDLFTPFLLQWYYFNARTPNR
eukprot:1027167-Pelagomonas_calceolata.AAC.1